MPKENKTGKLLKRVGYKMKIMKSKPMKKITKKVK